MNTTKINKLLKALPSDEAKQFGKTLKDKTILKRLFTYLNNPEKDVDDIDKMVKYVFGTQVRVNPQKSLRTQSSYLYKFLQKWLIAKELEADELIQNQLLANALKRHKVSDIYFETLKEREKLVETQTHRDMWYHLDWMRLAHDRYFHSENDFDKPKIKEYFTKTIQHLDDFYLFARLYYRF